MNLRRKTPNDSLYLLLDTLCNAFGGIILLAVLVVLLTSKEKTVSAAASDSQEMLQRRLAIAETNLHQALELSAKLQTRADDHRWKTQVTLLGTRQQLQADINTIHEIASRSAKELEAAASSEPTERMKMLNAQLTNAQARKSQAENSLAAVKENAKRLSTRLASLDKQASDLISESQRQLRLPKEHETSKRVIYIIARYGRIFTCRNSDLSRNETDIEWISSFTSETAEPRSGRGIDPVGNSPGLRSYFKKLSENSVYIAFCVFEDSFPAFIRAKQIATEAGLTYGWDPFRFSDGPVSFVTQGEGHTPKPQ